MAPKLIERRQKQEVLLQLGDNPAVALLGPRQAGKTTLARVIARERNGVYIDCNNRRTRAILQEQGVASYADRHAGRLIVIDEIQRREDLFTDLRVIIDERRLQGIETGCFLLLGSAAMKLVNKSTETLYGRLAKVSLGPLDVLEVASDDQKEIEKLWLRGGLPASFVADSDAQSFKVREQIVDILIGGKVTREGLRISAAKIQRLCVFLARSQGRAINSSSAAMQLDMDRRSVRSFIDLLSGHLMARALPPFSQNFKKKLVKTPKFYYRDSGLLHQLLEIENA
ncbi:MAG: ATP-binding protein, partial [Betaproteobacteria bacterium AqS2]|nr:ATP-binding protein [Betaproteobacteria bacterium AqS2]